MRSYVLKAVLANLSVILMFANTNPWLLDTQRANRGVLVESV